MNKQNGSVHAESSLRRRVILHRMTTIAPPDGYIPDPPGEDDDRFARDFKSWREWNVTVDFLTNLHFGADESEIFALKSDPPDVVFRDARFEVKEILDSGRRRHDEVKAARLRATAKEGRAPAEMYAAEDLTPTDAGVLVLEELNRLDQKHYLFGQRATIDLLFYINKLKHWFEDGPMPSPQLFEGHGWRSVSAVVDTQQSLVFHSRFDAPAFLIENMGVVRKRWESL